MFELPFVSAEQQRGNDYWCTNKTFNEYRCPHTDGCSLAQLTHTHGFLGTLWSCGNNNNKKNKFPSLVMSTKALD